jgi:hypothetical protein
MADCLLMYHGLAAPDKRIDELSDYEWALRLEILKKIKEDEAKEINSKLRL